MKRVFISGPITLGDREHNLQQALDAGKRLMAMGYAPLVPHYSMLVPGAFDEITHEAWMQVDLAWLQVADYVVRLPGESVGADREVALARMMGIPVFDSVDALLEAVLCER